MYFEIMVECTAMGLVVIQLLIYWSLERNIQQNTWHFHYSEEIESTKENILSSQIRPDIPVTTLSFDIVSTLRCYLSNRTKLSPQRSVKIQTKRIVSPNISKSFHFFIYFMKFLKEQSYNIMIFFLSHRAFGYLVMFLMFWRSTVIWRNWCIATTVKIGYSQNYWRLEGKSRL